MAFFPGSESPEESLWSAANPELNQSATAHPSENSPPSSLHATPLNSRQIESLYTELSHRPPESVGSDASGSRLFQESLLEANAIQRPPSSDEPEHPRKRRRMEQDGGVFGVVTKRESDEPGTPNNNLLPDSHPPPETPPDGAPDTPQDDAPDTGDAGTDSKEGGHADRVEARLAGEREMVRLGVISGDPTIAALGRRKGYRFISRRDHPYALLGFGSLQGVPSEFQDPHAVAFTAGAADVIARHVEFRLRQVVEAALKLRRHLIGRSRSRTLLSSDIAGAARSLRIGGIMPLSMCHPPETSPTAAGKDETEGEDRDSTPGAICLRRAALAPYSSKELLQPRIALHWIAVEGVPPDVPWNRLPLSNALGEGSRHKMQLASNKPMSVVNPVDVLVRDRIHCVLSREHHMYLVQVQHVITEAYKSSYSSSIQNVMRSVATAAGLGQLLPFLLQFIVREVSPRLDSGPVEGLSVCVRLLRAIASNKNLQIFFYIHQVIFPLMAIILSPMAGCVSSVAALGDTVQLKRDAIEVVGSVLQSVAEKGHENSATLVSHVMRIFQDNLSDLSRPMTSLIGAVAGTRSLGNVAVERLLLPVLPGLVARLRANVNGDTAASTEREKLRSECIRILRNELMLSVRVVVGAAGHHLLGATANPLEAMLPAVKQFHLTRLFDELVHTSGGAHAQSVALGMAMLAEMMGEELIPVAIRSVLAWMQQSSSPGVGKSIRDKAIHQTKVIDFFPDAYEDSDLASVQIAVEPPEGFSTEGSRTDVEETRAREVEQTVASSTRLVRSQLHGEEKAAPQKQVTSMERVSESFKELASDVESTNKPEEGFLLEDDLFEGESSAMDDANLTLMEDDLLSNMF